MSKAGYSGSASHGAKHQATDHSTLCKAAYRCPNLYFGLCRLVYWGCATELNLPLSLSGPDNQHDKQQQEG